MGVYIKDTKMPKNGCQDCIFVKRSWKGDICPFLKREVSGNVERGGFQTDCPLIEIPPHGRLIDADVLSVAFQEAIAESRKRVQSIPKDGSVASAYQITKAEEILNMYDEFDKWLGYAETVIPAEGANE